MNTRLPKTASPSRKAFLIINYLLMAVVCLSCVLPFVHLLALSLSSRSAAAAGKVTFLPVEFTLSSYEYALVKGDFLRSLGNSLVRTFLGTMLNLVLIVLTAYPLSKNRNQLLGRNLYMSFFVFTMLFNGGMIPTYLVVSKVGLVNTPWAMIIPGACSIYNVIITRTYFINSIPSTLQDAAELDGANSFQYLMRVVLPLSKPIIAVIALYYAVGHWNDFYTALIYINKQEYMPLQSFLRDILMSNKMTLNDMQGLDAAATEARMRLAQTLKYSVINVSTVPVLCIYPFIQKYFVKGVMIGSVKG